jgi:hypothetical protein
MKLEILEQQFKTFLPEYKESNIHVMVIAFDADIKTGFTMIQGDPAHLSEMIATGTIQESQVREIVLNAELLVKNEILSKFKNQSNG